MDGWEGNVVVVVVVVVVASYVPFPIREGGTAAPGSPAPSIRYNQTERKKERDNQKEQNG